MKSGIFFINLDRVPERHDFMQSELQKIGLGGVTRFAAIDAKAKGALSGAGFRSGISDRWSLPKSAIACFESHRAVWKMALDQGLDAVLVMEDDMVLSSELPAALRRICDAASEFDVVKIDQIRGPAPFGPISQINGLDLRQIRQRAASAGAYVVSRRGLEKLIVRAQTYGDTLDDFLYTPQNDWQMFQLFPCVAAQLMDLQDKATQQAHVSLNTSERELDPVINEPDLPRGPIGFRLRKELRRLKRRMLWKFGGKSALLREGGYFGLIPMVDDLTSI